MTRLALLLVLLAGVPASAAPRPGFGWPLGDPPVVDRGFEPPLSAYGAGHRGVDLRAAVGAPVLAAGSGQVSYAGLLAGRGVVTVTHPGGLRTTYEPLAVAVHVGQAVNGGDLLGHLTTGHTSCRADTTCLHWGLLRGQSYLDPLSLVVPTRTRLLPLGLPPGAPSSSGSSPLEVARAERPGGLSVRARTVGATVATGALLGGIALLARRPAGPPVPPPRSPGGAAEAPVDLLRERRRRRAA